MPATTRKNTPRLRDGVMKRGTTWSYVIRVKDPETGISKPRWVGGFATEQDAKAARDQARVSARQGQYIDRNSITVAAYLDQWLEAHAVEVKPKTLQDYRHLINRHVRPYIGELRLQAMSPARLTKLYRELATNGGRDGAGLSPRTVEYVHAVLRKAFRDAVVVDQILLSNPVERAKRPRKTRSEPGRVWTPAQLRAFLDTARQHRLFAFYRLAAYTGARRGELLNLRWRDIDLDLSEIRITGSAAVIEGPAHRGNDQERPVPHRQHRRRNRAGTSRSPQAPGRGAAESRSRVARRRRLRVLHRLGRADPPRYGVIAHDHSHQHSQRPAKRAATSRPAA